MTARARLAAQLSALEAKHRRRALAPREGLDFASNDYLGLAQSPLLKEAALALIAADVPLGSGGSRLLRGNHPEHEALEAEAAALFGTEAALFMAGGFQANQAILSALPDRGDLVLYDALVHASTHEGLRLGRADARGFAHNDAADAARVLAEWRASGGAGQVWIAVESLYSMEGDFAPLQALAALAKAQGAVLIVDEAHATGVYGPAGAGLAHGLDCELLTLHTCGKGLGVSGGLVCGPREMIDILINRGRTFVFSTAPSPFTAALVRKALKILQDHPELQAAATARIDFAHAEAARCGLPLPSAQSQILPVIYGDDALTMRIAAAIRDQGFDVRGIRPPTVPKGTSRLRISITGNVSQADISRLFETIAQRQAA